MIEDAAERFGRVLRWISDAAAGGGEATDDERRCGKQLGVHVRMITQATRTNGIPPVRPRFPGAPRHAGLQIDSSVSDAGNRNAYACARGFGVPFGGGGGSSNRSPVSINRSAWLASEADRMAWRSASRASFWAKLMSS